MFRASEHEGFAAECLFELLAAGKTLRGEAKLRAFTACVLITKTMRAIRDGGR